MYEVKQQELLSENSSLYTSIDELKQELRSLKKVQEDQNCKSSAETGGGKENESAQVRIKKLRNIINTQNGVIKRLSVA